MPGHLTPTLSLEERLIEAILSELKLHIPEPIAESSAMEKQARTAIENGLTKFKKRGMSEGLTRIQTQLLDRIGRDAFGTAGMDGAIFSNHVGCSLHTLRDDEAELLRFLHWLGGREK